MIVLDAHAAVTPAGKPVAVPIPVAPVLVWVMAVKGVFILKVGLELAAPTVLSADTFMFPVAFTLPETPVKGIE